MSATQPATPTARADTQESDQSAGAFSVSMVVSGVRCLLSYVVFPWALPLLGLAGGVGPALGIAIGSVAIVFNLASIRRFWADDHRWKIPITFINLAVIVLLSILIGVDIADLAD